MAQVRIESSEVNNLATTMHSWLSQMNTIRSGMVTRVRSLESKWNDPQYHMFLDQITGICNTLKSGIDSLETMRRVLQEMAKGMDAQAQLFRRGIQAARGTNHW